MRQHGGVENDAKAGRHPVVFATAIAYVAFVGWVTLGPQPVSPDPNSPLRQLIRAILATAPGAVLGYAGLEFLANVLLFVPVGILFAVLLGRRRWWLAIVVGVGMTVTIETAQLFIPTRVSDIRDIIANTAGAALGVALVRGIAAIRRPARARQEARE